MMKNILLLIFGTVLFGCTDFLDESPNKNGNNYIATLDDLNSMLQNSGHLYGYGAIWGDVITASDDFGLGTDPSQFYQDRNIRSERHFEYIWDEVTFDRILYKPSFTDIFKELSTFNTVLENLEKVDGDNEILRKQVEAEAKFYRAYYHFFAVVAYCQHPKLNNGENLGMPYRKNTNPLDVPSSRGTVKQTMDAIYKDLSEAEALLHEAGDKAFDIKENFRITLTNLKAFEARLRLYDGDYEGADEAAKLALTGYSTLNNLNDAKYDFNYDNQYFIYKYIDDDPTKAKLDSLPILLSKMLTTVGGDGLNGNIYEDQEYYVSHQSNFDASSNFIPLSDELYDSYENVDLRKKIYLTNNFNLRYIGQLFNNANYTKQFSSYAKYWSGASTNALYVNIGISVPEVMLIRAECASRGFGDGNALQLLKELRSKRFSDTYTDMIGSTTADVLAERRREIPLVVRWYDLKRLNAVENANITVIRNAPIDGVATNMLKEYSLVPNAGFYALPIPLSDLNLLGWEQNTYGGVIEK